MKLKANITVKQCGDPLDILPEGPVEDSAVEKEPFQLKLSMTCDKCYQQKWKQDATQ